MGKAAKTQSSRYPERTIVDSKRLIGRRFRDREVQDDIKRFPFTVVDDGSGKAAIELLVQGNKKRYSAEDISSFVLAKMKAIVSEYLDKKSVDEANIVVTVPANFNFAQRQMTMKAASLAGLKVTRILNEPTAAALAYAKMHDFRDKKVLLIFDLGGGTLDVTIMKVDGDKFESSCERTATRIWAERTSTTDW